MAHAICCARGCAQGESVIAIEGELVTAAPPGVVWAVLTDYQGQERFVPDLIESRVVSAPGEPILLEQRGEARALVFRAELWVRLRVEEHPPDWIQFRSVAGNMSLRGEWSIRGEGCMTRVRYRAEVQTAIPVPPLIGPMLIRRRVRGELEGVAREIARRASVPVAAVSVT